MIELRKIRAPTAMDLLVAFSDLHGFDRRFVRAGNSDDKVFRTMDAYAEFADGVVSRAGGTIVKLVGDGVFMVFPAADVDDGALALLALKAEGDRWLQAQGIPCTHNVKAHLGPVVCGPFGPKGRKQFDVYGTTVNLCARIPSPGVALSAEAFRALGRDTRKLFRKQTPPAIYVRLDDHRTD